MAWLLILIDVNARVSLIAVCKCDIISTGTIPYK